MKKLALGEGVEPSKLSLHDKQSCVFASFTTPDYILYRFDSLKGWYQSSNTNAATDSREEVELKELF